MRELVSEAAVEGLGVIGSAVGAAVFTVGGLLTEQDGARKLLAGHLTLGGWEVALGLLFLVIGLYLLGYREFWRRLKAAQSR